MISVETIARIRGWGIKKSVKRVNSHMIYLIYCKNFCKCHSVPSNSTAIKTEVDRKNNKGYDKT
jgi:hypothetical protein